MSLFQTSVYRLYILRSCIGNQIGQRRYTPRGNLDKTQQHDRERQGRKQSHHSLIPVQSQDERIKRRCLIR